MNANFPEFALAAVACWAAGLVLRRSRPGGGMALYISGVTILSAYALLLWSHLGRPPMRTLGETRLLYAILPVPTRLTKS